MPDKPTIEDGRPPPPGGLKSAPSMGQMSTGGYSRRGGDNLGAAMWALAGPQALVFALSALQAASALEICTNPLYVGLVGNTCTGLYAYSCAVGIISAIVVGFVVVSCFKIFQSEKF